VAQPSDAAIAAAHIPDCLAGHAEADIGADGRCLYCDELLTPANYEPPAPPPDTHTIEFVDGPCATGRMYDVPTSVTVIRTETITYNEHPQVGTLWQPRIVDRHWYRVEGERGYHMPRPTTP
jgi:hypothetical protein